MSARKQRRAARTHARDAGAVRAPGRTRRPRVRLLLFVAIGLGYAAIMWFFVFPWLDRFVNRPAV